jgi:TalC/MipB family fructose-6-phosphate aldolase
MELYLDSVDFNEIRTAFDWGYLTGLTTTPTFMHRHGITDIDGAIVELSSLVPVLQVEALGENCEEILAEAARIRALPLNPKCDIVFKIPVSNEGLKACRKLTNEGHKVNVHLVYTLNQAYMAMAAGATYVCPLVGRMHDQGIDAMTLIKHCIEAVDRYKYNTKIMVSSVRHAEHVRQAIRLGAHTCTIPWSVLKALNSNNLTQLGTDQFFEHTRLMTVQVKDVIRHWNPVCRIDSTLLDAMLQMTDSKLGAVAVLDEHNKLKGIFTDGDLRRHIRERGKEVLEARMKDFEYTAPLTVNAEALLYEAVNLFKKHQVDNLIVVEGGAPVGMLDIQDFVGMGLIG